MNHRQKQLPSLLAIGLLMLTGSPEADLKARADSGEIKYKHVVLLSSSEIKNYLEFSDSSLSKFNKITVKTAEPDGSKEAIYEELYSCQFKAAGKTDIIGCKRTGTMRFKDEQIKIAIKMKEKQSPESASVCAYALPHLIAELYIDGNFPSVFVPAPAFEAVKSALQSYGYYSSKETSSQSANTGTIPIQLQTEPASSMYETLFYRPSLKK